MSDTRRGFFKMLGLGAASGAAALTYTGVRDLIDPPKIKIEKITAIWDDEAAHLRAKKTMSDWIWKRSNGSPHRKLVDAQLQKGGGLTVTYWYKPKG